MSSFQHDIKTFHRVRGTPSKEKSSFDTSPSRLPQNRHIFTRTRGFRSEQSSKAIQSIFEISRHLTSQHACSDEQEASEVVCEQWIQIKQIVKKISRLQNALISEKKMNKELDDKVKLYEAKIKIHEDDVKREFQQSKKNTYKYQNLLTQLKQQHENLKSKDEQIAKRQQTFSQVQMNLLKKIGEIEQKLKKANLQNKDLLQKLRRSNTQLQKQRNFNKQLRKEMSFKIQNMQSNKQNYLIQEISNLKQVISCPTDEKQKTYLQEINALSRRLYQYQEELRTSNIQLSLMQRKKQQAVKQVCDKKDQEIKIQKTMFKTLNQKLAKVQEDFKRLKKENSQSKSSQRNASRIQQSFLLELSPDKY